MINTKHLIFLTLLMTITISPVYALGIEVRWNSVASSNINLGTVMADGTVHYWAGGSTGLEVRRIPPQPNMPANLYVRASGDFSDGYGNTIPLSNFRYSDYGGSVISPRSFETTNRLVRANWRRGHLEFLPVDLYLTVPIGTEPGNYTVTIYHIIVSSWGPQPVNEPLNYEYADLSYSLREDSVNATYPINGSNNNTGLREDRVNATLMQVLFLLLLNRG